MAGLSETKDSPPIHRPRTSAPPKKKTLVEALEHSFNNYFYRLCDFAKDLDKNKHIYWLYGGPDGFVLAYSMLKYPFDLIHHASKSETAKALHEFLRSTEGFAFAIAWLAVFTITSAYANYLSKEKSPDAKAVYVYWQAFRDALKGLRNAYRGIKSSITAMQLLTAIDASYALLPLGLVLGIPSMYNRWWNRHMVTVRKKAMDKNDALSTELLSWGRFNDTLKYLPASVKELKEKHANSYLLINKGSKKNRKLFYINHKGEAKNLFPIRTDTTEIEAEDMALAQERIEQFLIDKEALKYTKDQKHPNILQWQLLLPIQAAEHFIQFNAYITTELQKNLAAPNQAHNNHFACYLSAGYGGFTNGLYLFASLASLVPLAPEALFTVALMSAVCVLANTLTSLQEEYEYQKLLEISEQKTKLRSSIKTFQAKLAHLNQITTRLTSDNLIGDEHAALVRAELDAEEVSVRAELDIYECYSKLFEISKISDTEAFLVGLRHGLNTHATLVCLLFASSMISTFFLATALPQMAILACVALSTALAIHFVISFVLAADKYRTKQELDTQAQIQQFKRIVRKIKQADSNDVLAETDTESPFEKLIGTPPPTWYLLNWIEVARSAGSGIMKGPKSIDFIFASFFDTADQHDHGYSDPFTWFLRIPAFIICCIIWTLRALAKFSLKLDDPHANASSESTHETPSDDTQNNGTPDDDTPNDDTPKGSPRKLSNDIDYRNWLKPTRKSWADNEPRVGQSPVQNDSLPPQGHSVAHNRSTLFSKTSSLGSLNDQNTINTAPGLTLRRYTSYTADTSEKSARPVSSLAAIPSNTSLADASGPQ